MKITGIDNGWCHLCGEDKFSSADVWFAENPKFIKLNDRYLRICYSCAGKIVRATKEKGIEALIEKIEILKRIVAGLDVYQDYKQAFDILKVTHKLADEIKEGITVINAPAIKLKKDKFCFAKGDPRNLK